MVKDGFFAIKTNDTYAKIDDSSYYLYAYYDDDGKVVIGLAE